MSQLALSTEAGVTPRHVSFVESGRANPSREMVLTLARALDVPLRERNQMLLAAGFAPLYRETGLDAEGLRQVRAALDTMLAHHEPFPAVVMNRHWNVMMANAPAEAMFAFLLGGEDGGDPPNVVRLMFGPVRPHVADPACRVRARGCRGELLLAGHHGWDAAGRDAAGAQGRGVLPGR